MSMHGSPRELGLENFIRDTHEQHPVPADTAWREELALD